MRPVLAPEKSPVSSIAMPVLADFAVFAGAIDQLPQLDLGATDPQLPGNQAQAVASFQPLQRGCIGLTKSKVRIDQQFRRIVARKPLKSNLVMGIGFRTGAGLLSVGRGIALEERAL